LLFPLLNGFGKRMPARFAWTIDWMSELINNSPRNVGFRTAARTLLKRLSQPRAILGTAAVVGSLLFTFQDGVKDALTEQGLLPASAGNAIVQRPMAMAGFQEHHHYGSDIGSTGSLLQAKYIQDKAQLVKAMADCKAGNPCPPGVSAFSSMLEKVKLLSNDRAKVMAINAWANTNFDYSMKGTDLRTNLNDPTMLDILARREAVCFGISEIKLFALEQIGIPARMVSEDAYDASGQKSGASHEVVLVNLGNESWVLNNQSPVWPKGSLLDEGRTKAVIYGTSLMEDPATHLNFSGRSEIENGRLVPEYFFDSNSRGTYNPHKLRNISELKIPPEAETKARSSDLRETMANEKERALILDIMNSALNGNYTTRSPNVVTSHRTRSNQTTLIR
jgi:hypothetical protein